MTAVELLVASVKAKVLWFITAADVVHVCSVKVVLLRCKWR